MEKSKLLDRVEAAGDDRILMARVLDKLEQARVRNIPACTGFLSPQEQKMALELLRAAGAGTEDHVLLGGYEGAERRLILFLPDWLAPEEAESQSPLRWLRAEYRPEYGLTHRDILGSLMGLGVVREKIGDLLVNPDSCDLPVLDTVAEFLLQSWDLAGRAALKIRPIEVQEVRLPEIRCREIRDTVQTLRLDALAATGFQMSRAKAAALIEGGKIQVNWRDCVKPDHLLAEGDSVTARGFGKFEVAAVGGVTRKGRTSVVLRRYE